MKMIIETVAMVYLAVLAIVDGMKREISMGMLALGMVPALGVAGYVLRSGKVSWELLLLGAVPGAVLLAVAGMSKGAGAGDGMVLLLMNFVLFLERVILAFGISLIAIGAFSALLFLFSKGGKELRIPYLPFLWLGCVGAILLCGST